MHALSRCSMPYLSQIHVDISLSNSKQQALQNSISGFGFANCLWCVIFFPLFIHFSLSYAKENNPMFNPIWEKSFCRPVFGSWGCRNKSVCLSWQGCFEWKQPHLRHKRVRSGTHYAFCFRERNNFQFESFFSFIFICLNTVPNQF